MNEGVKTILICVFISITAFFLDAFHSSLHEDKAPTFC